MDKASAPGAGDSRFESWADQVGAQEKWQAVESLEHSHEAAAICCHEDRSGSNIRMPAQADITE